MNFAELWRRALGRPPVDGTPPPPEAHAIRFADVWKWQQQYDLLANSSRRWLDFARDVNLGLLIAGAALGVFATLFHDTTTASSVLAAVGAAILTAAGIVRGRFATPSHVTRWTTARAIAESLDGALYQYRAGFTSLDAKERESRFAQRVVDILAKDESLEGRQYRYDGKEKNEAPECPDMDIQTYVATRAAQQRDWHIRTSNRHRRHAARLGWAEFLATTAAAVLTAMGAFDYFKSWLPWAAVATTVAAAVAARLAAAASQRIAASYGVTIGQLKLLTSRFDPDRATLREKAEFVTEVEAILTAQNNGWAAILTRD